MLLCAAPAALAPPGRLHAQRVESEPPVIDSVSIEIQNIFSAQEAEKNFLFALMNGLRVPTRRWVISRELLLDRGEPFDSLLADETERNLRRTGLFRDVAVDTVRSDGRLVTRIRTRDSWSTKPLFKLAFASDGTWTGRFGINESNLLGTGNYAHAAYRREVDRDGLELAARLRRLAGSGVDVGGGYFGLSDGNHGTWWAGDPWREFSDRRYIAYGGEAAGRRVLRYRTDSAASPDTAFFWRTALVNRATAAVAPLARPDRYVRVGGYVEIRKEEYVALEDTARQVPDTVKAFVGVFGEFRRADFRVVRYLNDFREEDLDLSPAIAITLNLAPTLFGWERSGIGPGVAVRSGGQVGSGFVVASLAANALFNSAGLDSGRVVLRFTAAQKPGERHASILHLQAGMLENPPPGGEFDLGFDVPPRGFQPHSFTGTRMVWGTLEHRWFAVDELLGVLGLGLAAFVDYGGAWYPDQDARAGGNVGLGLRMGSPLRSVRNIGRLDLSYRFGEDLVGDRWVLSFGSGFDFP